MVILSGFFENLWAYTVNLPALSNPFGREDDRNREHLARNERPHLLRQREHHGQVEGERLAAAGPGADDRPGVAPCLVLA